MSDNTQINYDYVKLGDCIELMKDIPDNSIDCIITSPPYNKKGLKGGHTKIGNNIWKNFNIDYDEYNDNLSEEEYEKWQTDFLNECYRVIKENGSIFYNHKIRRYNNKAYFPQWVLNTKNNLYQMIIWNRLNCCDMRKEYLYPTTELIFWLVKGKPKTYKQNAYFKKEIWDIAPSQNKNHPASFPESLVENCILLTTEENDIVLDPFVGGGTTAIVAKKNHRHYIGFDVSDKYVNLTSQLLNDIK